jgi:hypothetical protein
MSADEAKVSKSRPSDPQSRIILARNVPKAAEVLVRVDLVCLVMVL